jgi:hypothetical protein
MLRHAHPDTTEKHHSVFTKHLQGYLNEYWRRGFFQVPKEVAALGDRGVFRFWV